MRHWVVFLLWLCAVPALAQTEEEIRTALDQYDYETPIRRIAPALGDSVFTPLRAQSLKAMNRYQEALKEWDSLLEADSADINVLIELAECYRLTHRGAEAAACYGKAVALRPENKYFRQ